MVVIQSMKQQREQQRLQQQKQSLLYCCTSMKGRLIVLLGCISLLLLLNLHTASKVIGEGKQFQHHEQQLQIPLKEQQPQKQPQQQQQQQSQSQSQSRQEEQEGEKSQSNAWESNGNDYLQDRPSSPLVIAHVVSLIKCGKQAAVTGFLDAAAVLRHSIHHNSIHGNGTTTTTSLGGVGVGERSNYSYQMYAIVHAEQCAHHAYLLERLGYTTLIRPTPLNISDITTNDWFKGHVGGENCCGELEYIKLYAYTLMNHPIVVHWDMDVAVLQPIDEIYDVMLFHPQSIIGKQARQTLQVQHPQIPLPSRIDAMFTKDLTSSKPWEHKQGVQGGFLVVKPNLQHFQQYIDFILQADYVPGRGNGKGWGGLGYGGFQGAMAYQGIVAYFYGELYTGHSVDLNACVYNQVVADVLWRGPERYDQHHLQCREYPIITTSTSTSTSTDKVPNYTANTIENGQCEDCRIYPIHQTKTVHYTACKKPWECTIPHPRTPRDQRQVYRLQHLTNVTTCSKLFIKWFQYRKDFELQLQHYANVVPANNNGDYESQAFMGYCRSSGGYIPMNLPPDQFDIRTMYGL